MHTPARYLKPEVYQALASHYVCGLMRGKARDRFTLLMQQHNQIAQAVNEWEQRLDGLNERIPAETPKPSVWKAIEAQTIAPRRPSSNSGWPSWLANPWLGLSSLACALLVTSLLVMQLNTDPVRVNYVAIMEDSQGQASWVATSSKKTRKLKLERVSDLPGQEGQLVLWAKSREDGSYYRFGELGGQAEKWIALDEEAWQRIKTAESLLISDEIEPARKMPSGQLLAQGLCVQLNYEDEKPG